MVNLIWNITTNKCEWNELKNIQCYSLWYWHAKAPSIKQVKNNTELCDALKLFKYWNEIQYIWEMIQLVITFDVIKHDFNLLLNYMPRNFVFMGIFFDKWVGFFFFFLNETRTLSKV